MKVKLKLTKNAGPSALEGITETGRVYLALDVHARHCVLGAMREDGAWLGEERVPTSAEALRELLAKVQAPEKWLTFEEGGMSLWLCDLLRPLVQRLLVCDPREPERSADRLPAGSPQGERSESKRLDRTQREEAR